MHFCGATGEATATGRTAIDRRRTLVGLAAAAGSTSSNDYGAGKKRQRPGRLGRTAERSSASPGVDRARSGPAGVSAAPARPPLVFDLGQVFASMVDNGSAAGGLQPTSGWLESSARRHSTRYTNNTLLNQPGRKSLRKSAEPARTAVSRCRCPSRCDRADPRTPQMRTAPALAFVPFHRTFSAILHFA